MIKKHEYWTLITLKKWVYIFISISFFSCNFANLESSIYKEVATNYRHKDIKLNEQKFYINLPKAYLPAYSIISSFLKETVDSTLMGIYNEKNNTVDIFNLEKKKLSHQIILSESIVEGYSPASKRKISINSIYIVSLDSIFLLTEKGLFMVDSSGKLIYSKNNLNFTNGISANQVIYRNSGNFPIHFDSDYKTMFMYGFCNKYSTYSNKFYDEPIEYAYNINSEDTIQLPMKYSELFKTGYFSVSIYPNRLIVNNRHIYTFQQDPNIYIYDKIKKEITAKGGKSKFQTEVIPYFSKTVKFSKDEEIAYLKTVPNYGKVLYDSHRNLFYRFFQQGQPRKNKEGLYNLEIDKYESLMIFDRDFNVINEISLERYKYFSAFSFVTKDGLCISDKGIYDSNNKSDSLKFYLLTIQSK